MAFSRALGVICIISGSWLAAVGCGDDDSNPRQPGGAGEGGEAGDGGTSSAGTSPGGASSAGQAGDGVGGTADGGTGNEGGSGLGGQPVNGGAGEGGGAGDGGAGGAGGAGGESADAGPARCLYECEVSDDCFIDESNPRACDLQTNRCFNPQTVPCVNDTSCLPVASMWTEFPCQNDDQCADDDSERCVAVDGRGYCALLPPAEGCEELSQQATELPVFGAPTVKVTVCASVWDRCREDAEAPDRRLACFFGCGDPIFGGFCGAGAGDTCNEVTGMCDCTQGAECEADGAGTGVCGADKRCAECVDDQDCVDLGAAGKDKCFAGKCGCAAASSCPDVTQTATPVCE